MTSINDAARDCLHSNGVMPDEITRYEGQLDQAQAWIAQAAPLAVACRRAAEANDWARVNHLSHHMREHLAEAGFTEGAPQTNIIDLLLAQLADFALIIEKHAPHAVGLT